MYYIVMNCCIVKSTQFVLCSVLSSCVVFLLFSAVFYCVMMCCIVLCCCIVKCCVVQCCVVLYCVTQFCFVFCCVVLLCSVVLYSILLCCAMLCTYIHLYLSNGLFHGKQVLKGGYIIYKDVSLNCNVHQIFGKNI